MAFRSSGSEKVRPSASSQRRSEGRPAQPVDTTVYLGKNKNSQKRFEFFSWIDCLHSEIKSSHSAKPNIRLAIGALIERTTTAYQNVSYCLPWPIPARTRSCGSFISTSPQVRRASVAGSRTHVRTFSIAGRCFRKWSGRVLHFLIPERLAICLSPSHQSHARFTRRRSLPME
jgi:hypothetical protein